MKKTLLTLAMMLAGMLSTQAQSQSLILDDSKDDMVTKINEAAEKGGTYNIRFSKRTINLNTWNVLVLPFDVKPGVIGKAFGSSTGTAAVDVLNVNNENPNTMHFSIVTSGVIPAGTPFIILATEGKTTFREVTDFTNVEVKKVVAQMVQTDKNGNRFIGVFSPTTFYGKGLWYMSQGMWKQASKYTAENPVTLKPFRAYIEFSKAAEAPMIIIDEPDGTTTVIDPATFNKGEFKSNGTQDDGWYSVTGMRLTQEPTAKGVYIHNARKVVIK